MTSVNVQLVAIAQENDSFWLVNKNVFPNWLVTSNAQDKASKYYNFNIQSMELIVYMNLKTNLDDVLR